MTELLTQQMQQLLQIVKEQMERISVLESRVDSLEMCDPPAIKSLYETLMGNDSTDVWDSSFDDDMLEDGIAQLESNDSTLPPEYSPPSAPTDILLSARQDNANAKTIQRYTRDEIIDIGRRWTLFAGMPAKQRKVEHIPLSEPLSLDNLLQDSNNAPPPTVSSLRITIDNDSAGNVPSSTTNMSSMIKNQASSDTPRKSFRQILEMYSGNNSGRSDMLHSTQTATSHRADSGKNNNNRYPAKSKNSNNEYSGHIYKSDSNDSSKSNHMKKNAHRVVKLQNQHNNSIANNNNTKNNTGQKQGNQQMKQKSLVQSNRCHGSSKNKLDAKKEIKSQDARIACTFDPLTMFAPPVGPSRSEEELIRESSRLGTLVVHAPGDNDQSSFIDA